MTGALGCLFFFFFLKTTAQNPSPPPRQPIPASPTRPKKIVKNTPLEFTFSISPEISEPDGDTLPDLDFRMYDPARRKPVDWGNLGNFGGAARPLFFETKRRTGFTTGIQPYDLYQNRPENLRFYRNANAFTDVAYSRGLTQDDGNFTGRFARTFAGGLNFSLDYRNAGQLGQYRHQRVKHQALSLGGWLPVNERYEAFFVFTKNTSKQEENGGISDRTQFNDPDRLGGAIEIPVWLESDALSRHANWDLQLTHYFKLLGAAKRDSTGQILKKNARALRLAHTLTWGKQNFKFADADVEDDSGFYKNFWADERGLRHFIELEKVENAFALTTFKSKMPGRRSDFLSAGITHTYYNIQQEPESERFSNLFLNGNAAITPSPRFNFTARGDLGLLKNIGEYHLSGQLKLGLGKAGELRGTVLSQRFPPALVHQKLFVSKQKFWENDFQKPVETSISATYALPAIGFEATGATHLVNNFIFFNRNGLAEQTSAALSVSQLLLRENLRLGPIRFDNTVALQKPNRSDVLHLPEWFAKSSLYFSGKIFKKRMTLETGVDFRTNGAFAPDAYHPLSWQFYLQDTVANEQPFPWVDAFISFKVSTLRIFFRYENIGMLLDPATPFYQTWAHPQPLPSFRFGARWRFMDSNLKDEKESPGQQPGPPGSSGGGTIREPRF